LSMMKGGWGSLLAVAVLMHAATAFVTPPPSRGVSVARPASVVIRAGVPARVSTLGMAAKKKKGGKKKKAPAAKKAAGFAKPDAQSEGAENGAREAAAAGPSALSGVDDMDGMQEEVRVDSESLRAAQEQAQQQRPATVTLYGTSAFSRLEEAEWRKFRLAQESSNEDVLKALRAAIDSDGLSTFVAANRDFVVKRFQVWMMAEAVRMGEGGEGSEEAAVRKALSALIVANREFDSPFAFAVNARERALNEAFEGEYKSDDDKPTITDLAGVGPMEQLGFWVVIASAKEAWLDRLAETEADDSSLREAITRKLGQMDQFLEAIALSPEIQAPPVPVLLQAMSQNAVPQEVVSPELIFQVGSILGCVECLRYQSYSALATRLSTLMDVLATGQTQPLSLGTDLPYESALSRARDDGTLSSLIKYEIEQEKIDSRDTTVKLGDLLGIGKD